MSFLRMPLIDIIEQYPATMKVFQRYEKQAGACFLCSDFSSPLEDVCRLFGLEPDLLEAELEEAIEASDEEAGQNKGDLSP